MRRSLSVRILCLWLSCLLLVGNLCNAPVLPRARKGSYPCEGHVCGCKSAEDCRRHCCCNSHTPIKEESCGHVGVQHTVPQTGYSFLRSLVCMGYPHKFSPLPDLVFLLQWVNVLPEEEPQGFTKEYKSIVAIQSFVSPVEKPPRPLA